jgi:hypothetical protein
MALKQTIEAYELLESATVSGSAVAALLGERGLDVEIRGLNGSRGSTDVVRVVVPGARGRQVGGEAPTLGIIGMLGGVGARPTQIGLVSDADGAITALAAALKLADLARVGDTMPGDVIVTTHVCPRAPTRPHQPVPFMNAPVDLAVLIPHLVDAAMEAVLSIDATRGNRVVNHRGIAVSPSVKEGYVLRVSDDLLTLVEAVTGCPPVVLPVTTQDITPYGNDVYHINSIMQPATVTAAPVVGLALTAEAVVPGPATGASQVFDIEQGVRLCVEVAKAFGSGRCRLYDPEEYALLVRLYGSMRHLQTRSGAPSG